MKRSQGLQRKTPLKRGTTPLQRGKSLKADPAKALRRTAFRPSPEKVREQWAKERDRAREKVQTKQQSSPAKRKAALAASSGPKASAKPHRRTTRPSMTADEKKCRQIVSERSDDQCEMCGNPGPLEKAHRIARSQGGRWDPSNVLDLCHFCHHGNHAEPQVAYDHGWHLRGFTEDTTTVRVLIRKGWSVGWALLDDAGGYEWVDGPTWNEDLLAPHP